MAGPDRLVWSPQAQIDLADIWRYYANAAGAAVADKIAREIVDSSKALERFPYAGRTRDDVRPQLRSVVVSPFVIFYRLAESTVQIVRVLDGRRDLDEIFAGNPQD